MDIIDNGNSYSCIIQNEDQAWALLQRVLKGEFGEKPIIPTFDGWPSQEIVFWLDDEHEVLTAPMMEALLDYQSGIYRAFMLVVEDTTNLRKLSNEYRREYEIRFQVGKGCTKLIPDFTSVLEKFATAAASNMTGTQITITIIGVALLFFGNSAWKAWLEARTRTAAEESKNEATKQLLSAQRFASEQDTARTKMLVGALETSLGTRALIDASEEGKHGVLRAATRMDSTEVADVEIEPNVARRIARNGRTEPEIDYETGNFVVLRNDANPNTPFKVKVRNLQTNEEFSSGIRDALVAGNDRQVISEAEWTHSAFWARVEVLRRRGEVSEATIVEVGPERS
jgi:hypothetical protein